MRVLLVLVIMMFATLTKAQTGLQNGWLPLNYVGDRNIHSLSHYDSIPHSKWLFSKYMSLSTGYSFFKGGATSFVAAPIGLQLTRNVNNHLSAFAGVSVAPAYFNFNGAFAPNAFTKTDANSTFLKTNNFGVYSKVELGLMYTNEAKTFSISGSIGVQRSSAPVFYPATASKQQNPVVLPNRTN